jgi:hypothetical protein
LSPGYLYVRRHERGVTGSLFGQRRRARGWPGRRVSAARNRRGLNRFLVGLHDHASSLWPIFCRPTRATAPFWVPLRSRPSAFAGGIRGHPVRQLRLRCSAASAAARCWSARFVFNSPGALGLAACQGLCQRCWRARSAPLAGPAGIDALNTRNAAQ